MCVFDMSSNINYFKKLNKTSRYASESVCINNVFVAMFAQCVRKIWISRITIQCNNANHPLEYP